MEDFRQIPNVNAHLHTPFSFSAFDKLTDALDKAKAEDVKIAGINDFYSMDGFVEWKNESLKRNIYPLFNIEWISLRKEDQENGIRVNDPNNPGRTYISGKGLCCPPRLRQPYASQLARIRSKSNAMVKEMCNKVNERLYAINAGFAIHYSEIENDFSKGLVRERHLAKALRMSIHTRFENKPDDIAAFIENLFNGKPLESNVFDSAGVENEIRRVLFKSGGMAFVQEDPNAFLPMEDVCQIILEVGGIPTYPFLGDDATGRFTEFETDIEKTVDTLKQCGIFSAEFITTRNSIELLEKYAGYLLENGFIVTFGSEHNTPVMEPVKLSARNNVPLTEKLKKINYEGACIIAAHQERMRMGQQSYIDANGIAVIEQKEQFFKEGHALIQKVIN